MPAGLVTTSLRVVMLMFILGVAGVSLGIASEPPPPLPTPQAKQHEEEIDPADVISVSTSEISFL